MAFCACGGNEDGTGLANRELLIKIIKNDFLMSFDIEEKIKKVNDDEETGLTFDQFSRILSD